MRRLPPLNSIRAFEAAARNRSFTSAANELCVTVTAVSHQVKNLEDQIGRKLFERTPREVRLTPVGERLFPLLRDGFDRFAEAFDDVDEQRSAHSISVSTTRAFAERWLMPRLPKFSTMFPQVSVNVEGTEEVVDLHENGVDIAIRYGRTNDPSLVGTRLLPDSYRAVVRASEGETSNLESAMRARPLLAYRWHLRTDDLPSWSRWMAAAGLGDSSDYRIAWYNDESMAMHAMEQGMGPLLCSDVLVADAVRSGTLRYLDGPSLDGFGFKIVHAPMRRMKPAMGHFVEWIREEADAFLRDLSAAN